MMITCLGFKMRASVTSFGHGIYRHHYIGITHISHIKHRFYEATYYQILPPYHT